MFRVAFTGHRPHKLGNSRLDMDLVRNEIKTFLQGHLRAHPDLLVISGGALGVDQFAAEICVELKIPFVFILPFPVQVMSAKWNSQSCQHLQSLISSAVKTYVVQKDFSMAGYQLRNEFMVNHCDILCAVWNGSHGGTANCIQYAKSRGVRILNLHSKYLYSDEDTSQRSGCGRPMTHIANTIGGDVR